MLKIIHPSQFHQTFFSWAFNKSFDIHCFVSHRHPLLILLFLLLSRFASCGIEVSSHSLPWNKNVILVTLIRRGLPAFLVSPLLSPSCWDVWDVCWDLYGRSWHVIPPSLCCAAVIDFLFWWTISQKIHNDYSSGEEGTCITVILFCGTIVTFPSCFLKCCFWVMHSFFSSCKCMNYIA